MKTQKLYFLDASSEICHSLDYFSLEELEVVNYELYKAIPDNDNKDFIYCTLVGEVGEREFCKKSQCNKDCPYYKVSGKSKICDFRGKLKDFGKQVKFRVE